MMNESINAEKNSWWQSLTKNGHIKTKKKATKVQLIKIRLACLAFMVISGVISIIYFARFGLTTDTLFLFILTFCFSQFIEAVDRQALELRIEELLIEGKIMEKEN